MAMSDAQLDTFIGASIAIVASVFNAVGYSLEKKGHNNTKEYNKDKDPKDHIKVVKDPTWGIGFAIYLVGGLLNAVALFYAPQSLVLPLSAITLAINTGLATKILGEPFFKVDIIGIVLVIIGSILAVLFGPRTAGGQSNMNALRDRWGDADFFIFFIILSGIVFVDYIGIKFYERKNQQDNAVINEIKYGSTFLLLSYCLMAAYYGANAFLFLKSFTEFIGSSTTSKKTMNQNFRNWYSWVTLIFVVIANVLLEYYRQQGLSYFHAVYVVPINQVLLIVLGTLLGGLYFKEFDGLNSLHLGLFIFAIFLTVIGVFILAFNSGNNSESTDQNISHALSKSIDKLPTIQNLPSVLNMAFDRSDNDLPILPITRAVTEKIPDQHTVGMLPTAFVAHSIHQSITTLTFGKRSGRPFYYRGDTRDFERGRHNGDTVSSNSSRTVTENGRNVNNINSNAAPLQHKRTVKFNDSPRKTPDSPRNDSVVLHELEDDNDDDDAEDDNNDNNNRLEIMMTQSVQLSKSESKKHVGDHSPLPTNNIDEIDDDIEIITASNTDLMNVEESPQ